MPPDYPVRITFNASAARYSRISFVFRTVQGAYGFSSEERLRPGVGRGRMWPWRLFCEQEDCGLRG
jgi:hypothetical protein